MTNLITDDFQIFVKPVGASCNLRCDYCYYLGKSDACGSDNRAVMDDRTLENYIKHHYSASSGDMILFTWHGGEPLLAGIDFYKKVVSFQKKYLPSGKNFLNAVQTNATLVDDEWCDFFVENKFSVGISFDGPDVLHDRMRHTVNGTGSFEKAFRGHSLLRKNGINPEILCVVNSYNVFYPLVVYEFFKTIGARYITFIPLVERDNSGTGLVSEKSVPAFEFGLFLIAIFDEWVKKDIGNVKIQIIEEALRTAFRQEHSLCIFREECGGIPVIERNGNFYPCDHFVDKNTLIGNINEHTLTQLLYHHDQKAFGASKRNTLPEYCHNCDVKEMCNGECPKNRFITSPDGELGLNYLCEGYRFFFNHCKPFIDSVAKTWSKSNSG